MDDFEKQLARAYLRPQGEADDLTDEVTEAIAHPPAARLYGLVFGAGLVGLAATAAVIGASGAPGRLAGLLPRLQMDFAELAYALQPAGQFVWRPGAAAALGLVLLAIAASRLLLREN